MLRKLLALMLLTPTLAWAQYLAVNLDTQLPAQQQVIDHAFSGNSFFIRAYIYENGIPLDMSAWTVLFRYSYGQFDTNGMVTIPGTVYATNRIDFATTNVFALPKNNYYWSISGSDLSGHIKTFGVGTMKVVYDPATSTNLVTMMQQINMNFWSNNVGAQVNSNTINIANLTATFNATPGQVNNALGVLTTNLAAEVLRATNAETVISNIAQTVTGKVDQTDAAYLNSVTGFTYQTSGDTGSVVKTDARNVYVTFPSPQASTGAVTSVNGQEGVVVLTTSDIGEGTNLYYTDGRVSNNPSVVASVKTNQIGSGLLWNGSVLTATNSGGNGTGTTNQDWNAITNKPSNWVGTWQTHNAGDFAQTNDLRLVGISSNQTLYDTNNILSLDWGNRQVTDTSGRIAEGWNNRCLYSSDGYDTVLWENKLLRSLGSTAIDWGSRTLNGTNGSPVLYWGAGITASQVGAVATSTFFFVDNGSTSSEYHVTAGGKTNWFGDAW